MANIKIENGWESEKSSYKRTEDKKGKIKIVGRYMHHQAPFEFSLNTQSTGAYLLRGSIRAIDNKGNVLKIRGNEARKIMEQFPEKERKDNHPKLDIRSTIYCNTLDDEDIKKQIGESVQKLYNRYALRIMDNISSGARPDNITPNIASQVISSQYINYAHPDASTKTKAMIQRRIQNMCAKLPAVPMESFKKSAIRKWIKENGISDDGVKELEKFWNYCIESGTCRGENPIEKPRKTRARTGKNAQNEAARRIALDVSEQSSFYNEICREKTDYALGAALMMSGFDASFCVNIKCGDVILKKEEDHVLIRNINNDFSTATKDYTRPLVPTTAILVREKFNRLKAEYPDEDIKDMYLLQNPRSKSKPMDSSRLIQEVTRMLIKSRVSYTDIAYLRNEDKNVSAATKLLKKTYENNIVNKCNLAQDLGTKNFLLGRSLGSDVSSDSYTSFTSLEGERRLYSILKILGDGKRNKRTTSETIDGDYIVKEKKPDQVNYGMHCIIEVTMYPGEEISVSCEHGLYGFICAQETEFENEQIELRI